MDLMSAYKVSNFLYSKYIKNKQKRAKLMIFYYRVFKQLSNIQTLRKWKYLTTNGLELFIGSKTHLQI